MKIVTRYAKSIKQEVVEQINIYLKKYKLPQNFVEFMALNNTGTFLNKKQTINGKQFRVCEVISFDESKTLYYGNILDYFLENSDGKMIPFAVGDGSDYYCLNLENNEVYVQSNDEEEDEFIPLNITFDEFIDLF